MTVLLWTALFLSYAAEPEVDEPVADEIVVYADLLVERARDELVEALQQQGYTDVKRREGYSVLMHRYPHRGQVYLYDDGRMAVRRQGIRFGPHKSEWSENNPALAWLVCVTHLCVRPGGVMVGKRKFKGYEDGLVRASQSAMHNWNERLADRGLGVRVDTLPAQLQLLWDDGIPLEEGELLVSFEERRAALHAFWRTRTDTPHGDAVRRVVEAFVRGEVQNSEHPFSADEDDWFTSRVRLQDP